MKKHCYLLLVFSCWRLLLFGQSFDPILAAKLQNTVDSFQTAYTLKGISASVIYPGQGMWQGVSGVSHAGVPITTDMEFAIASNTKLFSVPGDLNELIEINWCKRCVRSSGFQQYKTIETVATDVSSVAKKLRVYDPLSMLKLVY